MASSDLDIKLRNLLPEVAIRQKDKNSTYGLMQINYHENNFWTIKDNKYETFWREYCKIVQNPGKYYIAEVADSGPVVFEFNFKFVKENDEINNVVKNDFIQELIDVVTMVMIQELNISEDYHELICFVLESANAWIEGFEDDGYEILYFVRLQFPYCNVSMNIQKERIRPLVVKELRMRKWNEFTDKKLAIDWDKIVNSNIPYSYLPLYNSITRSNVPCMKLTHVYKYYDDEDDVFPEIEDYNELFDVRYHSHIQEDKMNSNIFLNGGDIWLPMILSIGYFTKKTYTKDKKMKQDDNVSLTDSLIFEINEPQDDIEFIEILLPMLSKDRYKKDVYLDDIGKALYKAYNGSNEGLDRWIRYCKEMKAIYDSDKCENRYPTFRGDLITYKTLGWYASKDSPDRYMEWHMSWVESSMEKSLSMGHNDIAEVFYRCNWLNYVYATNGKKDGKWYQYDTYIYRVMKTSTPRNNEQKSHRWKLLADGTLTLGKEISGNFLRLYDDFQLKKNSLQQTASNEERDKLDKEIKNIMKVKDMLTRHNCKAQIINECKEKFYIENFDKNLDTNTFLLGMDNCVIDLTSKTPTNLNDPPGTKRVRDGKPEDFISMSTNQRYRFDYTFESRDVILYMNYLSQVFSDQPSDNELKDIKCNLSMYCSGKEEELEYNHCMKCENCKWGYNGSLTKYVRKDISSMLKGRNAEKLFRIWSGSGDNSKSVYMKLLQKAFGLYCIDMPITAITQKKGSSSSASPEMARSKGSRIAITSEPDDGDKIIAGLVKSLTGNDRFFARQLFDNGTEIDAHFKLICVCNKIPSIPNGGKAIKNRVKVNPFLSTFVDKPPEDIIEQKRRRTFLKDPNFEDNVDKLATAMIWLAIQDYDRYVEEGLNEPSIIKAETDMYWQENDPYEMFIRDCLNIDIQNLNTLIETYNRYAYIKKFQKSPRSNKPLELSTEDEIQIKKELDTKIEGAKYLVQGQIYKTFKLWYREEFPGNSMPDSPQVKIEMLNRLGAQINRRWYCVSIKEEMNKY